MLQDDDHETTGNALLLSDPLLVSSSYQKSGSLEFADIITPKEVEEEALTPSPRRILLTVDDAIDHADVGMGRFQVGILVAAGFCFAADGILIMLLTFLGPILQYEWQLSPSADGLDHLDRLCGRVCRYVDLRTLSGFGRTETDIYVGGHRHFYIWYRCCVCPDLHTITRDVISGRYRDWWSNW